MTPQFLSSLVSLNIIVNSKETGVPFYATCKRMELSEQNAPRKHNYSDGPEKQFKLELNH